MGLVGWLAVENRSQTPPSGDAVAVQRRLLRTTVAGLGILGGGGVELAVPEVDAPRIEPGQAAEVRFDAAPDDVVRGSLVALASRATTVEGRTLVTATVDLDGEPPRGVIPGMTAVVTIVVGERPGVAMIPLAAVHQRSGRTLVTVAAGTERAVRLGDRDGGWVEVLGGLDADTAVLVPEGTVR